MGGRRAFVVVLDSVGCGFTPDAGDYGDAGADTLAHTAVAVGGLHVPVLASLGLGYTTAVAGVEPARGAHVRWARLRPRSAGKDTTTGHWELMGLTTQSPLPTYPEGFPVSVIEAFTAETGYGVLGNRPASGTDIINELGAEHLRSGAPIVYTSADSVFQVAAHTDVMSLDELYRICEIARYTVLVGAHAVGRVIARPFAGNASDGFVRVPGRHDYALPPAGPTLLSALTERDVPVVGVGKIRDIFAGVGVSGSIPTADNGEGLAALNSLVAGERMPALGNEPFTRGFAFVNLVDFDSVWGHRRNPDAYAEGLAAADTLLGIAKAQLGPDDLLIVTADHGCDPTWTGTDHTREAVPALVYSPSIERASIGTLDSLGAVGATVGEWLGIESPAHHRNGEAPSFHAPSLLAARTIRLPDVVVQLVTECVDLLGPSDELFLVGGALRDAIRASYDGVVTPNTPDIDLALNGSVDSFIARACEAGFTVTARNEALDTARLRSDGGAEFDLAATRAERYLVGSAYPTMERNVPIEWDLARRDFTVNAMALPAACVVAGSFTLDSVIDPHHGERDIAQRTLRVLHAGSFVDDPTRLLRLLRFARRLGFTPDAETDRLAAQALASGEFVKVADRQLEREAGLLYDELGGAQSGA